MSAKTAYVAAMDPGTGSGASGGAGANPFAQTGNAAREAKFLRISLGSNEPMTDDEKAEYAQRFGGSAQAGGASQVASK